MAASEWLPEGCGPAVPVAAGAPVFPGDGGVEVAGWFDGVCVGLPVWAEGAGATALGPDGAVVGAPC
jgi:hypothetical protein